MTPERIKQILDRHKKLLAKKQPWLETWQLVCEYVYTRKSNFTYSPSPGQFLTGKMNDATAAAANHLMASTMIGALWPNGAKTFQILPPIHMEQLLADSTRVKTFFERITKRIIGVFDHPRAGFLTALEEYMQDQGSIGTSGIHVERTGDPEMPVRFVAVDAKRICIDEGADGFVDTVYVMHEMTIRQLAERFSPEYMSKASIDKYNAKMYDDKVKVLHAVEPRVDRIVGGEGSQNMPIASAWIEVDNDHCLMETGYDEMPMFITRFYKAMGEVYGRSPASEGFADIQEINIFREAAIKATEKLLDPPLLLKHDGSLGGGTLDTSAGAVNVQYINGRIETGGKIVEQLVTVGELNSTYKRIEELREIIFNHFFIDRLLDLNNETRMTLGEAQIRNELRGQSLGTIYARQIAELFAPIITRVFNIMYNDGLLGVEEGSYEHAQLLMEGIEPDIIPTEILELIDANKEAYRINFISPAARIMRSEELQGILRATEYAITTLAPAVPDVLDNIDFDVVMRKLVDLMGASTEILRSSEAVADIREARARQQAELAQMEAQKAEAEASKNAAQAMAFVNKAQAPTSKVA